MDRNELVEYVDNLLAISEFSDASPNGLQVEGKNGIEKIVCGVSVSQRLFEAAVSRGADMILVHHGLFWKGDPYPMTVTGILRKRLTLLLSNQINLAAYHLPLDAHAEFGNNVQILKRLDIPVSSAYEIGFIGLPAAPIPVARLHQAINKELETESMLFDFGRGSTQKLAVISGSSSFAVEKAAQEGVDTFVGGDIKENHVRTCEELGMNFIAAGHYNTEKFGVQALCDHLSQRFDIQNEFVDIPNPV